MQVSFVKFELNETGAEDYGPHLELSLECVVRMRNI